MATDGDMALMTQELHVLHLEMRAGFAEVRLGFAEMGARFAEAAVRDADSRARLSTLIDSVADLRNEYVNHVHPAE